MGEMTNDAKLILTGREDSIVVENAHGQYFHLTGNLTKGGFIANPDAIQSWHKHTEITPISQLEKEQIMTTIMQQTIHSPFKILFDETFFHEKS
ncbi:hypothetical protein HB817_04130 [Listeria booriae]|uniref:hypothetical protein n=2 Tax=Listeria booriae TaxID=1552123 RepID=UPI00162A6ECB|nr:hypothetical protein [Listeria booriae]MBC1226282.1 hypothetical protein [Listeria booriae]